MKLSSAEREIRRSLLTLAAAARLLDISRPTLKKWHACGYIHVITIGPPGHEIPRVPRSEVERLQRETAQKLQSWE